ncbi:MAG: hypothetical protein JEY97_05430 [Bacteroidales bacterium]|nr:hypothetical protein [Bacteroidales bacterium]
MKTKNRLVNLLITIFTFLLLANLSCIKKDINNDSSGNPLYETGEGEIDAQGGTIIVSDPTSDIEGSYIIVPENALSSPVFIKIVSVSDQIQIPGDTLIPVIKYEPDTLTFNIPVELGFSYDNTLNGQFLRPFSFLPYENTFIETPLIEIDNVSNIIKTQTDRLSYNFAIADNRIKNGVEMLNIDGKIGVRVDIFGTYNENGLMAIPANHLVLGKDNAMEILLDEMFETYSIFKVKLYDKANSFFDSPLRTLQLCLKRIVSGDEYLAVVLKDDQTTPIYTTQNLISSGYGPLNSWFSGTPLIFNFKDFVPDSEVTYFVKVEWVLSGSQNINLTSLYQTFKYVSNFEENANKLSGMQVYSPSKIYADYINSDYLLGQTDLPSLTSGPASSITETSASISGSVINIGTSAVTKYGHCWATSSSPTIINFTTDLGSSASAIDFVSNMTGLLPFTTYYVRAYAINATGASYSNEISFTTSGNSNQPVVFLSTPAGSNSDNILITFTVTDPNGANNDFTVKFKSPVTELTPASIENTTAGTIDGSVLHNIPPGTNSFIWKSANDFPDSHTTKMKIFMVWENSTIFETDYFEVNNIGSGGNTAPTAIFNFSPEYGSVSTLFSFDASDSNDDEDPGDLLQVRWDWENDGTWDTEYSLVKTATHQFTQASTYTVKMEVKDTQGLVDFSTQNVSVTEIGGNTPPAAIFTFAPNYGTTSTIFSFDGSQSYDNEDPQTSLKVRWDWENDGTWDTDFTTAKTATHQFAQEDTYTVKMQVIDTEDLSGFATHTVYVNNGGGNTPPEAIFTYSPETGNTSTVFTFNASLSNDIQDPEVELQVRWDWENDGSWDTYYSTNKIASHQYLGTGTYTVKLEVRDTEGLSGFTTLDVEVSQGGGNSPPTAIYTIFPAIGTTSTVFNFDASGSYDVEDPSEQLQVRWDWENDGMWDTQFSTNKIVSHQYSLENTYSIRMEVKDNEGATSFVIHDLIVSNSGANTAPTAIFYYNPPSGTPYTMFYFDAGQSFDYEDPTDELIVRWDWENDGVWDTQFSTSKLAIHQFPAEDIYSVKLEVRDTEGLSGYTTLDVTVSNTGTNTPPTAMFSIDPLIGTTSTIFSFDASASSDIEDPPYSLIVRWDWENDGIWDTQFTTVKTAIHQYSTQGTKTIKLEVKDTQGMTGTTTNNLTVINGGGNTPPVAIFYFSPSTGTTADIFGFDASGSYDNEDPQSMLQVRWDWESDGVWDTYYSTTKTTTHQFLTADTYIVKLEVMDTQGLTGFISHSIEVTNSVTNTPPVAAFTYSPENGNTNTIFSFNATYCYDLEDPEYLLEVRWDWESDGTWDTYYSTNKLENHQFYTAGNYSVKLEVKDTEGLTDFTTLPIVVTTGSGQGQPCPGIPTFTYGGQTYNTVQIGNQCWMRENLNFETTNSWCFQNDPANCYTYGRLYDWQAASIACPVGWHLPSDNEWCTLMTFLDPSVVCDPGFIGTDIAGQLKEMGYNHWIAPNTGATNYSGFTALPGGYRSLSGLFNLVTANAFYWTSTSIGGSSAWRMSLFYNNNQLHREFQEKTFGFSVRCVKN